MLNVFIALLLLIALDQHQPMVVTADPTITGTSILVNVNVTLP